MHLQRSPSPVLAYPANLASARTVVLGCVCSALGQPGQTATVQTIAAALATDLAAAVAVHDDLLPAQLTQTVERALDRATQQLTSRGVRADHVLNLVVKVRQELLHAFSDAAHVAAAASAADVPNLTPPPQDGPNSTALQTTQAAPIY
jgi:hypothetical protein